MKKILNNNEYGFAMLIELLLVAGVLALIGVALYQSNHTTTGVSALVNPQPSPTANTQAVATANAAIEDATSEATATAAEATANDELSASDGDVTNLENTSNASF